MKSIKGRLIARQLSVLVVMYAMAGFIIYNTIAVLLQDKFDEDLATLVETVSQLFDFEDRETDLHFRDTFFDWQPFEQEVKYYQIWDPDGKTIARSLSLKGAGFPMPDMGGEEDLFLDMALPDGTNGRAVAYAYINCRPSGEGGVAGPAGESCKRLLIVLACSREWMDDILEICLVAVTGIGVLLSLVSMAVLPGIVDSGLSPLNRMARKAASIGAANLDHRFSEEKMPRELLPIVVRLNDLLERLDKAFARERRFTSDVAHELRTPIAELRALAEVGLGMDGDRSEDSRPFFRDAKEIALQMQNLTNSLLELARAEGGNMSVSPGRFDLAALVHETCRKHEMRATERGIAFSVSAPGNIPLVSDRVVMTSVIGNLVSNAVSHAPEGGAVSIRMAKQGPEIHFSISNPSDKLEPDDLKHIFQTMWCKDRSRSDASHYGIGLALVKSHCGLLGISLQAEMPDPGTFCISLRIPANMPVSVS